MTTYTPRRLWRLLALIAWGLVGLRLLAGLGALRGAAARSGGFLVFNDVRAALGSEKALSVDQIGRGVSRLTQAAELAPHNESARRARGYLHLIAGDEAEALAAWGRTTTVAAELLDKGQAAEEAGQPAEALRWYEQATTIEPTLVEAWLRLGNRHEKDANWAGAESTYAAGLEAVPYNGDLLIQLGRVRARLASGDEWAAILAITDLALAHDQYEHQWNRAQTHYLRGEALRGLGRPFEALAEYTTVLANYPHDYEAALRRAEMYWATGGDPGTAEAFFQSAASLDPESKWAYHYLGRFYEATDRPAEARAAFERALQIDPADPIALEWLGRH